MDPYEFIDVNTAGAENVNGGVADVIHFAPKAWFTATGIKVPEAPFANPGDEITITATHEFLAGKGFVDIQCAPQKNKLTIKTKGDIGSNGQNTEMEFFVAGSSAQVHELFKNALNTPLIVLAKDANCRANLVHQLGCDCHAAWITVDFDTVTTKDGSKGFMVKVTYDDGPQFYAGVITKKP